MLTTFFFSVFSLVAFYVTSYLLHYSPYFFLHRPDNMILSSFAFFFFSMCISVVCYHLHLTFLTLHHCVFIFQTLPTTTYELEIVAKDMAGSEVGLRGTATATITITDKNDHAPEFTHPLVRYIPFSSLLPLNGVFSLLSP